MDSYNSIVSRALRPARLLACLLCSLAALPQQQRPEPPSQETQEPPEEDSSLTEKEYAFNPVQAEKEVGIGKFYFKKKIWKAALGRFQEAARWNPGYAEAWLRIGETYEQMKEPELAREAYARFLELAPGDKSAAKVRKKLGVRKPS